MADEFMSRIEKQLEGNNLALSAVAEVLQKMDGRLSRDEELNIAKQEEEQADAERMALVKEIASEVAGILKADAGMDVDGTKVRSAAKTSYAGDNEKPVSPNTKISDQQATIQAMVKEHADDEDKAEEYPVDEKKGGMRYKAEDGEDEEDDEDVAKAGYGEADGEEEDGDEDEMKSMRKQLNALKKQIAAQSGDMQKAIQSETENRLRKMGFREENGLQAPQRFDLGVDGTTPIKKTNTSGDVADQLAGLSYKELRELQMNIEAGKTEGLPQELVG